MEQLALKREQFVIFEGHDLLARGEAQHADLVVKGGGDVGVARLVLAQIDAGGRAQHHVALQVVQDAAVGQIGIADLVRGERTVGRERLLVAALVHALPGVLAVAALAELGGIGGGGQRLVKAAQLALTVLDVQVVAVGVGAVGGIARVDGVALERTHQRAAVVDVEVVGRVVDVAVVLRGAEVIAGLGALRHDDADLPAIGQIGDGEVLRRHGQLAGIAVHQAPAVGHVVALAGHDVIRLVAAAVLHRRVARVGKQRAVASEDGKALLAVQLNVVGIGAGGGIELDVGAAGVIRSKSGGCRIVVRQRTAGEGGRQQDRQEHGEIPFHVVSSSSFSTGGKSHPMSFIIGRQILLVNCQIANKGRPPGIDGFRAGVERQLSPRWRLCARGSP